MEIAVWTDKATGKIYELKKEPKYPVAFDVAKLISDLGKAKTKEEKTAALIANVKDTISKDPANKEKELTVKAKAKA